MKSARVTRCCDDQRNSYVEEISTFSHIPSLLQPEKWKYYAAQVSWGAIYAGSVDLEFEKQSGKSKDVVIREVRADRFGSEGEQAFEELLGLVAATYINTPE